MAKNLKFYFDKSGKPCARGPQSEQLLMAFLETDVQGDDHICHDLMEDITAIESQAVDAREFVGNAHAVEISAEGIRIVTLGKGNATDDAEHNQGDKQGTVKQDNDNKDIYTTGLKHFREILEDWEAFILDEQEPDL